MFFKANKVYTLLGVAQLASLASYHLPLSDYGIRLQSLLPPHIQEPFRSLTFYTASSCPYPNPLSSFVVTKPLDCAVNVFFLTSVLPSLARSIGGFHAAYLYILSGTLSSFAFIFSSQCSSSTIDSVACCSNGAVAGSMTFLLLASSHASSLNKLLSAFYLIKCGLEAYEMPREEGKKIASRHTESVVNAGVMGGVFFGIIHYTLLTRTRQDLMLNKKFHSNLIRSKW